MSISSVKTPEGPASENPDDKKKPRSKIAAIGAGMMSSFGDLVAPLAVDRKSVDQRPSGSASQLAGHMASVMQRGIEAQEGARKESSTQLRRKIETATPVRKPITVSSSHVKVLPPMNFAIEVPSLEVDFESLILSRGVLAPFSSSKKSVEVPKPTPQKKEAATSQSFKSGKGVPYIPASTGPEKKRVSHQLSHRPGPHVKVMPFTLNIPHPHQKLIDLINRRASGSLQVEFTMFATGVIAEPVHVADTVVGGCITGLRNASPWFDRVMKGAGEAFQDTKEWVKKEMPSVATFVREWKAASDQIPVDFEERYGIPQEQTRQWLKDTSAITETAVFMGTAKALGAAGRSIKTAVVSKPIEEAVAASTWTISGIVTPTCVSLSPRVLSATEKAVLHLSDGAIVLTRNPVISKIPKSVFREFKALPPLLPAPIAATASEATAPAVTNIKNRILTNISISAQGRASSGYRLFNPQVGAQKPLRNYIGYEPMALSALPSPHTAISTSFHTRIEPILMQGYRYDIQLICTQFECGTWSFFVKKVIPYGESPVALERLALKTRSALLNLAQNRFEAPSLVIQWDPQILDSITHVANNALKQMVHYAGEQVALDILSPLKACQRAAYAILLGASVKLPKKAGHSGILSHSLDSSDFFGLRQSVYLGSSDTYYINAPHALALALGSFKKTKAGVPTLTFDLQKKQIYPVQEQLHPSASCDSRALRHKQKKSKPKIKFVISDVRPVGQNVVVIESAYDDSGAFRMPIDDKLAKLAQGRNLIYKRGVRSFAQIIETMQAGNVSHVLVRAHGNPSKIYFDPYGTKPELLAYALSRGRVEDKVAKVFLESCSTAAQPKQGGLSFAQTLSQRLGDKVSVVAGNDLICPFYTQMNKGNIQFFGPSSSGIKDVTVRVGRIDNSRSYRQLLRGDRILNENKYQYFSEPPKVFNGIAPKDLFFIQYHKTAAPLNTWFIGLEEAKSLKHMGDIRRHTILNPEAANHVTITKIPAGDFINVIAGCVTSQPRWNVSFMHSSNVKKYYFYDFDPKWQSVTLPWPNNYQDIESFEALMEMGSELKRTRPISSLKKGPSEII